MHGTKKDGKAVCTFDGKEIGFFDPGYACPKGYWKHEVVYIRGISEPKVSFDEDSNTIWLNKSDLDTEAKLDATYTRIGELRWDRAGKALPEGVVVSQNLVRFDEKTDTFWLVRPDAATEKQYDQDHDRLAGQLRWKVRRLGPLAKVASLGTALLSEDATPEVMAQRKLSCFGDSAKGIPKCTSLTQLNDGSYCGTCSCGRWLVANMDKSWSPKITKSAVDCPMRKPGFRNSAT